MLKYQSCTLLLKRLAAVSLHLSASLCTHHPSGLLSVLLIDSGACPHAHARDKSESPYCANSHRSYLPCTIACCLPRLVCLAFAAPELTLYIQNQILSRLVHVSVSFSYACDLVVEPFCIDFLHSPSTPTITHSYRHPHHSASFTFGPTRTPVDTLLDFVPSSFGFSSMVQLWSRPRSHSSCLRLSISRIGTGLLQLSPLSIPLSSLFAIGCLVEEQYKVWVRWSSFCV